MVSQPTHCTVQVTSPSNSSSNAKTSPGKRKTLQTERGRGDNRVSPTDLFGGQESHVFGGQRVLSKRHCLPIVPVPQGVESPCERRIREKRSGVWMVEHSAPLWLPASQWTHRSGHTYGYKYECIIHPLCSANTTSALNRGAMSKTKPVFCRGRGHQNTRQTYTKSTSECTPLPMFREGVEINTGGEIPRKS